MLVMSCRVWTQWKLALLDDQMRPPDARGCYDVVMHSMFVALIYRDISADGCCTNVCMHKICRVSSAGIYGSKNRDMSLLGVGEDSNRPCVRRMLIPYQIPGHWVLICVDFQRKRITCYDSMGPHGDSNSIWFPRAVSRIVVWLEHAHRVRGAAWDPRAWMHESGLMWEHGCTSAEQDDGVNCGVWACEFARLLGGGADVVSIEPAVAEDLRSTMTEIRRRYACELITEAVRKENAAKAAAAAANAIGGGATPAAVRAAVKTALDRCRIAKRLVEKVVAFAGEASHISTCRRRAVSSTCYSRVMYGPRGAPPLCGGFNVAVASDSASDSDGDSVVFEGVVPKGAADRRLRTMRELGSTASGGNSVSGAAADSPGLLRRAPRDGAFGASSPGLASEWSPLGDPNCCEPS